MGISRTMYYKNNWRELSKPYPGADYHVANEQSEYVVFDQAQIVPCYVIHLDLGRTIAKYSSIYPSIFELGSNKGGSILTLPRS